MATKKNGNGRKRLSPSVERQIALALVAVLERTKEFFTTPVHGFTAIMASVSPEHTDGAGKLAEALRLSVDEAREVLKANGYEGLESVASRVAALELQLKAAMDLKQYKDIAPLGAALERARRGLPPLAVAEKKPTTERKPRTAKRVAEIIAAFGNGLKFCAANGEAVTQIKASADGKQCSVQFGDDEWLDIAPGELSIAPQTDATAEVGGVVKRSHRDGDVTVIDELKLMEVSPAK